MKKIIHIITMVAALSVLLAGCNKPEKPEGDLATLPKPAVITSTEVTNACPTTTITLTTASEGATGFQWYQGTAALADETKASLVLTNDGYFPDVRTISVLGTNASGTGRASEAITVTFEPCSAPEKSEIEGKGNVCPTPFARLTAKCKYAVSYKWFKDGVEIDGDTAITYDAEETGVYTVKGVNKLGEGTESEPLNIEITSCVPLDIEGIWESTGGTNPISQDYLGASVEWVDTIIKDTAAASGDSTFWMTNFRDEGMRILIYKDKDEQYYIPSGVVLYPNIGGAGVHGGQVFGGIVTTGEDAGGLIRYTGNIYLEVASDNKSFKLPALPDHPTYGPLSPVLGYGAFNGTTGAYMGSFYDSWIEGATWRVAEGSEVSIPSPKANANAHLNERAVLAPKATFKVQSKVRR